MASYGELRRSLSSEQSCSSSSLYAEGDPPSILVIGADGPTGIELIRHLSEHPSKPLIHAFCDDASSILSDKSLVKHVSTVLEGSARHAIDINEALQETQADWIVYCEGPSSTNSANGGERRRSNFRSVTTKNIAHVLSMSQFSHVRALVVSGIGASRSDIRLGLRGMFYQFRLRPILADHARQEKALKPIMNRSTIVRTTELTDHCNSSSRILELTNQDTVPTFRTLRSDLAACIVDEICSRPKVHDMRVLNVTSIKL
jgi:hypothetical protein